MYLIILNNEVIGIYDDYPTDIADGAELADWDGDRPEPRVINGIPYLPLDPRDNPQKLVSAKRRKLKEINDWDEATRRAGVQIGSHTLRYDDKGQRMISALLVQIRELVEQGAITGDTLVVFEDAAGDTKKVKASVVKSAMQTYFTACQTQDEAVGDLMAQLKAATTIPEVEAIIVG